MTTRTIRSAALLLAACALPATMASAQDMPATTDRIDVYGQLPTDLSGLPAGPDIDGIITARRGSAIEVTPENGPASAVTVGQITDIKARGGFLGLGRTELGVAQLLNGLPVEIETVQWEGGLLARSIRFSGSDLESAQMIYAGTNQRFGENEAAIEANALATEALRGRFGDIDQYNVRDTTNVYFDTGKSNLSANAKTDLCYAAQQAQAMDNALLLVVGYTDSVGDQDYNQELSEKRAGRVVNFLQQECDWQPWRMLTPTGMAEADPAADNSTADGRAQNRRVSVNILVSKAVDNLQASAM